jgi:hypothetical protein
MATPSSASGIPQVRYCCCGACHACKETERFIEVYERRHAAEEQAYYLEAPEERSPVGSSWDGIRAAARYPYGTPRFSNPRARKRPTQ